MARVYDKVMSAFVNWVLPAIVWTVAWTGAFCIGHALVDVFYWYK